MKSSLTCLVVAAFIAIGAGLATAAPIAIVNHDFEDDAVADGTLDISTPSGWTSNDATDLSFNPNGTTQLHYGADLVGAGTDGTMDGPTFGNFFSSAASQYSQVLGDTLAANTSYTLTVAFGNRDDGNFSTQNAIDVTIELLAGATVIATNTGDPDVFAGDSTFADLSANVVIGAAHAQLGQVLTIQISKAGGTNGYMDLDNVRLDATLVAPTIPAPAALPFGLALLGLIATRRR